MTRAIRSIADEYFNEDFDNISEDFNFYTDYELAETPFNVTARDTGYGIKVAIYVRGSGETLCVKMLDAEIVINSSVFDDEVYKMISIAKKNYKYFR